MTDETPMISVPVSRNTRRRIDKLKLQGESDNDTLSRVILGVAGPGEDLDYQQRFTASLAAGAAVGDVFSPGRARDSAVAVEQALSKVPKSRRVGVLAKAAMQVSGLFSPEVRAKLGDTIDHLRPDQQTRLAVALLGKTDERDIAETVVPFLRERHAELDKKIEPQRAEINRLERQLAAAEFVWKIDQNPVLEKLGETGFHKLADAIRTGGVLQPHSGTDAPQELTQHDATADHVFVVQHNWAAAFEKAGDFNEGEFRLPYDRAVFEFRVSGARVCLSVDCADAIPETAGLYVNTPVGWALATLCRWHHGEWHVQGKTLSAKALLGLCISQVRAVSIALDAEVAVSEVVRAPHKLNQQRVAKGRLPIFDYHVVSLSNRRRVAARLPEPGDREEEPTRKRLHFRRGHWRHFTDHRTWIHWMLVGDPDLGFVDKHYRL